MGFIDGIDQMHYVIELDGSEGIIEILWCVWNETQRSVILLKNMVQLNLSNINIIALFWTF